MLSAIAAPQARAGFLLGAAANFAVLDEGHNGHNFFLTADSGVTGNVGIGDTGVVKLSSGKITGNLEFAANPGSCSTNAACGGTVTGTISGNDSDVTSALSTVNSLSASFGNLAPTLNSLPNTYANLGIDTSAGGQTVTLKPGTNCYNDGHGNCVFNVTNFKEVSGTSNTLTVDGNNTGLNAVFNIGSTSNFNIDSGMVLKGGLTSDSVLFNFYGGNDMTLAGNGNLGSAANDATVYGIFLDPNGKINVNSINIDGQLFGGDSQDMSIVSNAYVTAPTNRQSVPESSSVLSFLTLLGGVGAVGFRKSRQGKLA